MYYVSVDSGTTANSGDMGKANKKIKDLEHRLSEKEGKIMEITDELMESVKKNWDVSCINTLCELNCIYVLQCAGMNAHFPCTFKGSFIKMNVYSNSLFLLGLFLMRIFIQFNR